MMLDKTIDQTRFHWEGAATLGKYREYIAQGHHKDDDVFSASGKHSVMLLEKRLKKYGLSLWRKRLVEIGCGAGRMTEFLAKKCSFIYAVDISRVMLERFKQRLPESNKIALIRADGIDFLPKNEVDFILSDLVFQHNNEQTVKNFFIDGIDSLKHGGHFVFQLPVNDKHTVVQSSDMRAVDMVYWTKNEITGLAKECGYEIISEIEGNEYRIFKKP